jgi:hypothetical protein
MTLGNAQPAVQLLLWTGSAARLIELQFALMRQSV